MKKAFEITDEKIINEILDYAEYGTLALCVNDKPYSVPINFVESEGEIFFHGAKKGKKIDIMKQNQNASFSVVENYLVDVVSDMTDKKIMNWFEVLTYDEAIETYGTDKPDLRYDMKLIDVIDIFANSTNEIFASIASDQTTNRIKAIKVTGWDLVFSKTQMKGFEDYVRKFWAKGLGYFQMKEDGLKGPLNKFFEETPEKLQELVDRCELDVGDVIFFGAGAKKLVWDYMGRLESNLLTKWILSMKMHLNSYG